MSLAAPVAIMKYYRGKLPMSVITLVVCCFLFFALLYTERISSLSSGSVFKSKSCARKTAKKPIQKTAEEMENPDIDDRFEFDPKECNVAKGKWVFNRSIKPLYTDRSCPYIDLQFSCVKNGRPDSDYRHWEWRPDECTLPRFNPKLALKKLRGKRLLFVGDSLQRGQWESLVCMVEWLIPKDQKSMKRGHRYHVFKAKEYNATIEFFWAPFIVESNTDGDFLDPDDRIIKVDSVEKQAKLWGGVDFLVFNTYIWWMTGPRHKTLWGSFANGPEGYEVLDAPVAYRLSLKTWANWVDSNVNPNKTRIFFVTMSPTHSRSADWGNINGTKCFNETWPVTTKKFRGFGSNNEMMSVVASVVERMKVPVTVVNVTQISEYRIDAHASVYTETGGKLLTEEQRADPKNADCIHWCLPGVPDTWNQILLASL
ncbi:hypothetical protein SLEP1_g17977 [Rubroshorea leprosula]|uniref:Trichome birefringence-like N-terminal domain-containing protein n=1 Tax=Rubroshorea leprosula TaxID=152421 RepID=A0AAV5J6M2_9ROSI|nr:hypothetical protein SLEP1_g17977 [Rubroshorea leprosula]